MTAKRQRLETLLGLRKQDRDQCALAYEQIRGLQSDAQSRLRELEVEIAETLTRIGEASAGGEIDVNAIARRRYHLLHQRRSVVMTSFELEGITTEVESARQKLVAADQQARVIERLIERLDRELRKERIKAEQLKAEDIWSSAAMIREDR